MEVEEDHILCLNCKPKFLLSLKQVLEVPFLHQLQNINVHSVLKENSVKQLLPQLCAVGYQLIQLNSSS